MTNHTAKIAVSLPAATLRSVETARRKLGRSRSSVVAEALEAWLKAHAVDDRDRVYLEGYARSPETDEFDAVAFAAISSWGPWDAQPAKRSRASKRR
jgi:hypothetical protein